MVFFPPELAAERESDGFATSSSVGNDQSELMRTLYFQRLRSKAGDTGLDRQLVHLVLEHAKQVVAHPSRPTVSTLENFARRPLGDLALEETIEENPFLSGDGDILTEASEEKPFSCVTLLDASASMSGDKHLLASIAVAVLLLEVESRDAGVVVFASQAKRIKSLLEEEAPEETILRFLRVQPKGFTDISAGLREGLKQWNARGGRGRKIGLIATDGRSTEGDDPVPIASRFDFLVVLHLHGPGSHLDASRAIAQGGHGICLEVERFEELPRKMYEAVRLLARR